MPEFIDIGANLTDPQFRGRYRGKVKHENDFEEMLQRAKEQGVGHMLVTASSLKETKKAMTLAEEHPGVLFATAGVHPCHAADVPKEDAKRTKYFQDLEALIAKGKESGVIKAFGELGLDYDRFHFAGKEDQIEVFKKQLEIASRIQLPLFLHSRACSKDFRALLTPYIENGSLPKGGVVHSFTGTAEELQDLLKLGLYIGVNGCSLKTDENLAVVKSIPLDRLMLETDGPWCEIRPTHASYKYITKLPYKSAKAEKAQVGEVVRGRCEPSAMINVAQVVAALHDLTVEQVAEQALANTKAVFGI